MNSNIYKLKDLLEKVIDNRGKTPVHNENSGIPLIEINAIKGDGVFPNYDVIKKYVDDSVYNNFRSGNPKENDILIGTVGSIGTMCLMDNTKASIAQNVIALRVKDSVNPKWLYYYLRNAIDQILNLNIGGVQPSIKVPHLMNMDIDMPDKETQDKIVDVLNTIDLKIVINNKISDNYHRIAKTLYRIMFNSTDSLSIEKQLKDLINLERGFSYKGKFLADEGTPMINLGNIMPDGIFRLEKNKFYTGEYKDKYKALEGDILIANTDMTQNREVIGTPIIVPPIYENDAIYTHHIYKITDCKIDKMFLFYTLLTKEYKDEVAGAATGTTILNLPKEIIENHKFYYKDEESIIKFGKIASVIQEKRNNLLIQNIKLESIKNKILPLIVNGVI